MLVVWNHALRAQGIAEAPHELLTCITRHPEVFNLNGQQTSKFPFERRRHTHNVYNTGLWVITHVIDHDNTFLGNRQRCCERSPYAGIRRSMLNDYIYPIEFDHGDALHAFNAASISAGPTFFIFPRMVCACEVFPNLLSTPSA